MASQKNFTPFGTVFIFMFMKVFLVLLTFLAQGCSNTKTSSHHDPSGSPENVHLITADISNFWKAYDLGRNKTTAIQEALFDSIYIKNASKCLRHILTFRKMTAAGFVNWINTEADYFSKCKSTTDKIINYESEIINYLKKFKVVYPAATFSDIYFMFTQFYTGGQSNSSGIAIGMDYWSLPDSVPVNFTTPLNRELVRKIDRMPVTIIHEFTHRNQKIRGTDNLLKQCLTEGGADFIAYLVTGKLNNPKLYEFSAMHEQDLWSRFKIEMLTNNTDYWIYNSHDPSRPRDLGYPMGFKICESFYNNAADKSEAVHAIMNIDDPFTFLQSSGYPLKFN